MKIEDYKFVVIKVSKGTFSDHSGHRQGEWPCLRINIQGHKQCPVCHYLSSFSTGTIDVFPAEWDLRRYEDSRSVLITWTLGSTPCADCGVSSPVPANYVVDWRAQLQEELGESWLREQFALVNLEVMPMRSSRYQPLLSVDLRGAKRVK